VNDCEGRESMGQTGISVKVHADKAIACKTWDIKKLFPSLRFTSDVDVSCFHSQTVYGEPEADVTPC